MDFLVCFFFLFIFCYKSDMNSQKQAFIHYILYIIFRCLRIHSDFKLPVFVFGDIVYLWYSLTSAS